MNIFLDTNAVVKLYHEEDGADNLYKFLEQNNENLILTLTDISKVEFHSVFFREVRTGKFELNKALEVFNFFKNDLSRYNIIEINSNIKDFAIELLYKHASKKSLRTLDAIQLSGAIFCNQLLKIDYFVSSDKKLIDVVKQYFIVFNPED